MPSPSAHYYAQTTPQAVAPGQPPALTPVDWGRISEPSLAPQSVAPPADFGPNSPIPSADVVITTWTSAEWDALSLVFTGKGVSSSDASSGEVWTSYGRGFSSVYPALFQQGQWAGSALNPDPPPSLSSVANVRSSANSWGFFRLVQVGGLRVLLFKSQLHISTDGVTLPLLAMTKRILEETGAGLLLSAGTSGAVQLDDRVGDVAVSTAAQLRLTGVLSTYTSNQSTFESPWKPDFAYVPDAQKLMVCVSGPTIFAPAVGYPLDSSILYADRDRRPQVRDYTSPLKPVLTTNGFDIATTDPEWQARMGGYCCLEMDDALLAKTAVALGRNYASVRNFSDPVMNAELPSSLQSSISGFIFSMCGGQSSYNGALAAWALIAAAQ